MTDLLRDTVAELNILETIANESLIDDVVAYFDRQNDHTLIREAIKSRYGIGIKSEPDPNQLDAPPLETYAKEGFNIRVDAGLIESLSTGFGHKVVNSLATLFTENTQKWSLVHKSVEDTEKAQELLDKHRDAGGFHHQIVMADKRCCQIGSSAMLVSYTGEYLTYQVLSPSDVRCFFSNTITDNGVVRATDPTDIEDASAVIIRLGQIDNINWHYLAIMGRSNLYEKGRYVTFIGSSTVNRVPPVGDKGALDYEIDGVVCNPMSYIADMYPDENLPEYPIAVFDGGTTSSSDVMPVSYSLYADCVEVDTAASHLLGTSQDAARGTLILTQDLTTKGHPIPRTLHGAVALGPGQDIRHESHDAAASVDALTVLKELMINIAGGYGVPDYMVVNESPTGAAYQSSSGIALAIKTRPLKKMREQRIELNKRAVKKVFDIEKALIGLFEIDEKEAVINLLRDCDQEWQPGELRMPENKKEAADRIIALMDKGIIDTIAAIREYYQVPTDEDAMEIYDKMKERANEYPSLAQPEKKQVGFLRGQTPPNAGQR